MKDWMHKSEALKKAEVSAFDAKRYLSVFSRFIPHSESIMQGSMVSPRVPEVLLHFKMLEKNGLSMEQIAEAVAGNMAEGKRFDAVESPALTPKINEQLSLITLTLITLMKQLADNDSVNKCSQKPS